MAQTHGDRHHEAASKVPKLGSGQCDPEGELLEMVEEVNIP